MGHQQLHQLRVGRVCSGEGTAKVAGMLNSASEDEVLEGRSLSVLDEGEAELR